MSQRHIYDSCPVRVSEKNVVPGAAICSHVPNRGEQMVEYYGYYSTVMFPGAKEKKKSRMTSSHASLKRMVSHPNSERTRPG